MNECYMKLLAKLRGTDFLERANRPASVVAGSRPISPVTGEAQSVSATITAGCGRRILPNGLQFFYPPKRSRATFLLHHAGPWRKTLIADAECKTFDKLLYEVEPELPPLIKLLKNLHRAYEPIDSCAMHTNIHQFNILPIQ